MTAPSETIPPYRKGSAPAAHSQKRCCIADDISAWAGFIIRDIVNPAMIRPLHRGHHYGSNIVYMDTVENLPRLVNDPGCAIAQLLDDVSIGAIDPESLNS